jgi:hypothetical protein
MIEALKRFMPQNFNDLLALVLIALIVALWIMQGQQCITLRDEVNGSLTVIFTLIIQYYYRKKKEE